MDGPRANPRSTARNHRGEPRSSHSLNIRYAQEGSPAISRGTLVDLTMRGAGVRTDRPLTVGRRLILEIVSPSGSTARCAAEIMHSRRASDGGYHSGARFVDLDEHDREALQYILRLDVPLIVEGPTEVEEPPPPPPLEDRAGPERRRAARFPVHRAISYKIFEPGGGVSEEGVAQIFDLSLTGVGLRTCGPVRQGISLQLEVVYSGGLRCMIEAECIYCRKDGGDSFTNGLRFTAVERSDLSFFSQLLAG